MKQGRLFKPVCFTLAVLLIATVIVLQPVIPRKAHANPAVVIGVINGIIGLTNIAAGQARANSSAAEMKKIQEKLDKQEKMLQQIQGQLADLQRAVDTLAMNLEIDTKEIQRYIQQLGAQGGIDLIKTTYDQLDAFAGTDITKMTGNEKQITRLKEDMSRWRDSVLAPTGGAREAITKIKSAVCPDLPGTQGVLDLWTDLSILKMPAPHSPANDFAVKVESITPSSGDGGNGGAGLLPVVVEAPQYFDYEGLDGGDISPGVAGPAAEWYFAEGSCRPGFRPFVCINNPGDSTAQVEVSYMLGNASVVRQSLEVPARFRSTVVVKDLLGEGDGPAWDFSTVVRSTNNVPVVAEMPQYFEYGGEMEGGFIVSGATSPAARWYLAEGTCRPDFHTFVTIQNPGDSGTTARLTYMRGDGTTREETRCVPAHSRVTVRPSDLLGTADGVSHDFSTLVESVDGAGLVVARPIYFSYNGVWAGGHCSTATTDLSPVSYLAEGTCRSNFATFITIQNPGDSGTDARLTYMRGDGTTTEESRHVPARSRVTVRPSDFLGTADDAAHDFSTRVESVSGAGLVVERPEYFLYQGLWAGGHCAMAAPAPSVTEYFAEGTLRPGFDPYMTIQNPNGEPAGVRLTYMWGDGHVTTEERTVPANARDTVRIIYSPAARTLLSYYNSLKGYLETLLYWQQKGLACIADAYNGRLEGSEEPPAREALDYISKTYKNLIKSQLDEFLACTESLVVSWSYKHAPNGLAPEASLVFADADFMYMNYLNSLMSAGTGKEKNYYGAFARVLARLPDTIPGVVMTGPVINRTIVDQTWHPAKLKYYDAGQQKLVTNTALAGFVRYHRNCEPGTYLAGVSEGNISAGGASPALARTVTLEVTARQIPSETEGPPSLPFGSATFMLHPRTGHLSQFGGIDTPQMMVGEHGLAIGASAGGYFCAYLQPGGRAGCGRIKGWGDNNYGQLNFPGGNDFVQVSAGRNHGLALRSDGSVVGWGRNNDGQAGSPRGKGYVQVAAGGNQSLALNDDGSIDNWGTAGGYLGAGYVQLAAGEEHCLALKSDGTINGWGGNSFGQTNCPHDGNYVQVAAGGYHSLALRKDGSIVGWGCNSDGQANCPPGNDFVRVAAGRFHSLALRSDGSIVAWGQDPGGKSSAPAGRGSVAIAGGWSTSLYTGGCSLIGWGDNFRGKTNCPGGNDYAQVSADGHHGLALRSKGSLVGWGENYEGQVNCPPGNDYVQVSAGGGFGLALRSDGSIVGWGRNESGQRNCPAGNDYVQVSAGDFHSLALKKDGSIVGWGMNDKGQVNCPGGNSYVQVSAGSSHSLALRRDGSIVGWGDNSDGQRNCPGGNDYKQVAAGGQHSLALRANGSMTGWGKNHSGESRPPGWNDYAQGSGGWYFSLGLRKTGLQPWSWR